MNSPSVQIGWLDLSDTEQARAREYLRQFRTEGTLDEMGFGIVRDGLADVFFPATSTIMTHTRYIIFIAAIFMRIEREGLSGPNAAKRLKQLEDAVRKILTREQTSDSEEAELRGVIGASAKEDLQRYPSIIYWNGLKRLGIFKRPDWGLTYYLDHLADYYAATTPRQDDDGLAHLALAEMHNWDPKLAVVLSESPNISPTAGFSPQLDFRIGLKEACYLRDRFNALAEIEGPSLISHLLGKSFMAAFSYPWEVPCPPELVQFVKHARLFSMFAKGATLQYYDLIVAEQKAGGIPVNLDSFEKPFTAWFDQTRSDLVNWDVEDFCTIINRKCRLRPRDKAFFKEWLNHYRDAGNGKELLRNSSARKSIRKRERWVRPVKYRLGQDKYLRQWRSPESLETDEYANANHLPYMTNYYRSRIGGTFVREIGAGLKRKI